MRALILIAAGGCATDAQPLGTELSTDLRAPWQTRLAVLSAWGIVEPRAMDGMASFHVKQTDLVRGSKAKRDRAA